MCFFHKIGNLFITFQTDSNTKVAFQCGEICGACGRMAKACDADIMLVVSVVNRPAREH